ncbi:MAG: diguanylate cyclase [Deltaproteobacteria bacterium]|nr:diguanylate cyclase [Deltaproteobacteria bacterium]
MHMDAHPIMTGGRENRILIIEDARTETEVFEGILRAHGYEVRSAKNGRAGIGIIGEWVPSLILLDIVMPGQDGISVCKEIRGMTLGHRPSIIMVSSRQDKKVIVDALSKGADDFIVKPFNEDELIARVKAQQRINGFYKEIEEDKKNLETLLAITLAMSATLNPPEVLRTIVAKVAAATGAARCSIVLVVPGHEGYVLASHEDASVRELRLDLDKYPEIRRAYETKTPVAINDMVNDPLMAPVKGNLRGLEEMSALILPIVFNDEVLGTLFLRARRKEKGFAQKEIDICRIVANSAFHAIRNARLFDRLMQERDTLQEIAIKDQLTSLYNHNFFYTRLEEEFDRAVRYDTLLSVIMMDIDNFKNINDTYGHRTGDVVLRELSEMIKRGVRKTDIVARYGGEEFAVILPHTSLAGAMEEGERLRELVGSHAYAGLVNDSITISVGVAAYPQKGVMNSGDLVNHADDALYKAKWGGKNCVRNTEG